MKAKIVTYTTEMLNPTQRSILSKRLNGYNDKSNKAKYTYRRKGILDEIKNIKIANKAIIVSERDYDEINDKLRRCGAKVKAWDINIKKI